MNIKVITQHNCEFSSIEEVDIKPINDTLRDDVNNFLTNVYPSYKSSIPHTSFTLSIPKEKSNKLIGVIGFEPNDVRTKYSVSEGDATPKNYNEITLMVIDNRLFDTNILTLLLKRIIPMIVSQDNIDEVIWLSYQGLHSKTIDKVFKSCNEYYFQNEAEFFANIIVSKYNDIENSWLSQIMKGPSNE